MCTTQKKQQVAMSPYCFLGWLKPLFGLGGGDELFIKGCRREDIGLRKLPFAVC